MNSVISMIAAVSENGVIGDGHTMPWYLPDDFKWFKRNTLHKPVIMGRKTFDSIGKPLVDRHNIVITRDKSWKFPGVTVLHSIEDTLRQFDSEPELVIIGGGQIYAQALPFATRLYLTIVHGHYEGEVIFPKFNKERWKTISQTFHPIDEKHSVSFTMEVLEKQ
jgi:dihydrofolate reductase